MINKNNKPKKNAKMLKIPLSTKQQVKNVMYNSLDTKESKKCIKKEKKIHIEKIFNKSNSKKTLDKKDKK
jgi:hypothetical protein